MPQTSISHSFLLIGSSVTAGCQFLGEPGTDGTFPLFREIVHPNQCYFSKSSS